MPDCSYTFKTQGGDVTIRGMAEMKAFLALNGVDAIDGAGSLASDVKGQEEFLQGKAEAAGYKTVDEFVDKDYEGFVAAAAEWRQENPAEVMFSTRSKESWLLGGTSWAGSSWAPEPRPTATRPTWPTSCSTSCPSSPSAPSCRAPCGR